MAEPSFRAERATQRLARLIAGRPAVQRVRDVCDNCDGFAEFVVHGTDVAVLVIAHDPHCPALAATRAQTTRNKGTRT